MTASALSIEQCRYGVRETTPEAQRTIPELYLVGHVNYHTARPSFFFHHQHTEILEIFYVVRGKVSWWVEGVSTEVCGNELFLIWPNEWHGAKDDIVEPAEYYWIQVNPQLLGRNNEEPGQFQKDLQLIPNRRFTGTEALMPLYKSLLFESSRQEPYSESIVRSTLHLLLSLVIRSSLKQDSFQTTKNFHHAEIDRAVKWTKAHVADATLSDMVKASGLTALLFKKHFFALIGISPMQYLIRLRLQHAKERLLQGRSITETAHHFGFSSSQYFATVFRKYEGISPTDFLERKASQ